MRSILLVAFLALAGVARVHATVYEVRPATPLDTIAEVPWATLQPGDMVLIHWRQQPYAEKWVIGRSGTAALPITVPGRSYYQTVQASGGSGNFIWSVSSGTLPAGLVLDPATGIIRGRPKLKGNSSFTVTVQDAQAPTATAGQAFTVQTFLHSLL